MIIDKSIKSLQNKIKKLEALQQKEQHEIDPNQLLKELHQTKGQLSLNLIKRGELFEQMRKVQKLSLLRLEDHEIMDLTHNEQTYQALFQMKIKKTSDNTKGKNLKILNSKEIRA